MTTILKGHVSPETAYVVESYPYGGLRCRMRYWLEAKPKHGVRLVSQSTNPKKGHVWNKPHPGPYASVAGCLLLDESNGHVSWTTLSFYCNATEAESWFEQYGEGCPEPRAKYLQAFVKAKRIHEDARKAKAAEGTLTLADLPLTQAEAEGAA